MSGDTLKAVHKEAKEVAHGGVSQKPFHITIGVATQGRLDLSTDLKLVKAAILYGDAATLCSLGSAVLVGVIGLAEMRMEDRWDFMVSVGPIVNEAVDWGQLEALYRVVREKKHRTKNELVFKAQLESALSTGWSELRERVYEMADEARVGELLTAVESGLLQLRPFEKLNDADGLVKEFVGVVADSINDLDTYPLLDDHVGGLVMAGLQEGAIEVGDASRERAKSVGLAAGLLERLPLFDLASVSEVIGIRRELEKPLVRFRSAIITLSSSVRAAAWDRDFQHDVETVMRRDLEPTVLELKEAVKSNSYLRELVGGVVKRPIALPAGSALGMLLSSVAPLSYEVTMAVGSALGAGLVALEAYEKWKAKQREIAANRFYFYYRAAERLGTRPER